MTVSFVSTAQAKSFFGRMESYLDLRNGSIIEIASNEINDDGTAEYFDQKTRKHKIINLKDTSKATKAEIDGVKAGKRILVTSNLGITANAPVTRFCEVVYLFENKMALAKCKATENDNQSSVFSYTVQNVEDVVAEVDNIQAVEENDIIQLGSDTGVAKAGEKIRVLAVFASGEALIEKYGLSILDRAGVLYKLRAVEIVSISDIKL
jgi:hypothetical protein